MNYKTFAFASGISLTKPFVLSFLFAICLAIFAPQNYSQRPIPPGVREADKQTNSPIEPPAKLRQKPMDPTQLKQEAEELAKLSAAIPAQVDQVAHDQIPKELANQLKRIEKLAKQLRSQISP